MSNPNPEDELHGVGEEVARFVTKLYQRNTRASMIAAALRRELIRFDAIAAENGRDATDDQFVRDGHLFFACEHCDGLGFVNQRADEPDSSES